MAEIKEGQKIWRISVTRMYFSTYTKKGTPSPFSEIRAIVFSRTKPTEKEKLLYQEGLKAKNQLTEGLFYSFDVSREAGAFEEPDDDMKINEISVSPTEDGEKMRMVIDGFEVEEAEASDIMKTIKTGKLEFDKIYRYVSFPENNMEYDERQIAKLEEAEEGE